MKEKLEALRAKALGELAALETPKELEEFRVRLLGKKGEVTELLRGKDIFDISQVAYAILEVNGELNVLLKSDYEKVNVAQLNLKTKKASLPLTVICDGKLCKESIESLQLKCQDVLSILKEQNKRLDDVFLMTLDSLGNFTIIDKGVGK